MSMPTVAEMVQELALHVVTQKVGTGVPVTGGYASDLLSCVMARAQAGNVWVTLQAHPNVVAIPVASTPLTTYAVVERLHDLGIHAVG
jgi:hypothetical protein